VRGADAVADQFEEAAVDDAVLGRAGLAVVVAQRSLVVGVLVAAEAQEVAAVAPVAGGGEHPRLDLRLIVVGGGLVAGGRGGVARGAGDVGGGGQAGDGGGGGGGGVALLLLPALLLGPRRRDGPVVPQDADGAAVDEEVGGGLDHVGVHARYLGVGDE